MFIKKNRRSFTINYSTIELSFLLVYDRIYTNKKDNVVARRRRYG